MNQLREILPGPASLFGLICLISGVGNASGAVSRDFGVDVSHYQGSTGISQSSWNQMYSDGKRFAYIKASEGLTGPDDAAMANNLARARIASITTGVYHYGHPENRPTASGAIDEADHFLSYAGSAIGSGMLRPVLDVEGSASSLTTAALTDWIIAFSNEITAQRGAGAAPIIYMNRSFAKSEVDSRLAAYDLWLAYYTNMDVSTSAPPPTTSYPKPTGVFNNWCFWQYSSTGSSGGISPLDLNVCHNEYKTLNSFLIPAPTSFFAVQAFNLGASGVRLSFTNTPGTHFTVLSSTEITAPLSGWTELGTAVEGPAGTFQFTDASATARSRTFYRVRSP